MSINIKELVTIGDFEKIKELVKNDIYISRWVTATAAQNGHLNIVKYLVENNKQVDKHAIEYAIINNHFEILAYLFETLVPAKIIMANSWIQLATRYCIRNKDDRILRYLILKGGKIPKDMNKKYTEVIKKTRDKLMNDLIIAISNIGFNVDISYLVVSQYISQ